MTDRLDKPRLPARGREWSAQRLDAWSVYTDRMPDTKEGRDEQADDEEQRQRERAMNEEREYEEASEERRAEREAEEAEDELSGDE